MTEKKISDKQLKKEIENGKTQKQIAYKYGYGYPSPTLSNRTEKLGFKSNKKAKIRNDGGINIYIPPKILEEVIEKADVEPVTVDSDEKLAYSLQVVDGFIAIVPKNNVWRKIK